MSAKFQILVISNVLGIANFCSYSISRNIKFWRSQEHHLEYSKIREFQMLRIFNFGNFKSWKFPIVEIPMFGNPNFGIPKFQKFQILRILDVGNL